jgi:hypothetical protein
MKVPTVLLARELSTTEFEIVNRAVYKNEGPDNRAVKRCVICGVILLNALNIAFFVFHSVLILFNVFGWAWKRTRLWNLITLLGTAFSWGVMGLWKGAGYCIFTDWHWQVREAMGIHESSSSYLVLLVRNLTGWDPPVELVNNVALIVFLTSLGLSFALNIRDRFKTKRCASA